MKNKTICLFLLPLCLGLVLCGCSGRSDRDQETITVTGAWALYPMMVRWSEEFRREYPHIRIDVSAGGAGKGITDVLTGFADLGMVSRDLYPEEVNRGVVALVVARDAVVATASAANPNSGALQRQGLSREAFASLWLADQPSCWSSLAEAFKVLPLHVYTRSDSCGAAEVWAAFLGAKQEDLLGIGVYGDPGMAEAVIRDASAIGYNNVNYAYDAVSGRALAGIMIVPIDLDGSGLIEEHENFYQDRGSLLAAIAAGRYPAPPARDLLLVHDAKPLKESVALFLNWINSSGQDYVVEAGYVPAAAKSE